MIIIWGFYKLYVQLKQKTKLVVDLLQNQVLHHNNISLYQPDDIVVTSCSWEAKILTYYLKSIVKIQISNPKILCKQFLQAIREHSFPTLINNYYQRNHSKSFLQAISDKSFQTFLSDYYLRLYSKQVLNRNFYQKTHWKQFLQTIIRKIISNKS